MDLAISPSTVKLDLAKISQGASTGCHLLRLLELFWFVGHGQGNLHIMSQGDPAAYKPGQNGSDLGR